MFGQVKKIHVDWGNDKPMKKNIGRRAVALAMALVFSFTSITYSGNISQAAAVGVDDTQTIKMNAEADDAQAEGASVEKKEPTVERADGDIDEPAEQIKCKVFVSGGEGVFYYKPNDAAADYEELQNGSVELEKGTYSIRYVGGNQKLVAVNAVESNNVIENAAISLDTTGAQWKQCWEATVTLSEDISLQAAESAVQISLQGTDVVIPDIEYVLQLTGEAEGTWNVSELPEYTLMTDASDVTLQKDGDIWKLKYSVTEDPILEEIKVDVYESGKLNASTGSDALPDFFRIFTVLNTGVTRGSDFDISTTEGMYAAVVDGILSIYHNGIAKTIELYKGRYTSYRYHFAGEQYPAAYTAFGDDEEKHTVALGEGALYLQMKNEDASSAAFGSSGEIKLISDTTAPVIEVYKNQVRQDSTSVIYLKKDDVLSVKAVEPADGSGIARLTRKAGENESLLAESQGRQLELSSLLDYTEESTELTIYAYDNVGKKETLTIEISADITLPVIEQRPGKDAYAYEGDTNYYVDSYTKEAVAATYQDIHLDTASIRADGPVSAITAPVYEAGCYTVGYQATGSGTVTFHAQDSYGNTADQVFAQVVVDTVAPVVNEGTVSVTDKDPARVAQGYRVYSPYGSLYEAEAFHEPLLSFQVTEENLWKVEVEVGDASHVITLTPNIPEGNIYTYKDIQLGETAFAKGNIKIRVYDKAKHETVYTYKNPFADKVTYVKNGAVLGVPEVMNPLLVKSGKTYVVTENGRMDMQLHISAELLVPELLELRLMRVASDGSRTQVASYREQGEHSFSMSGSGGEWDVLFHYTFSGADDGAYMIEAYYMDIALNKIISAESAVLYYIDQTPVTLSVSSAQVTHGGRTNQAVQVVYTMKEENPDFDAITYEYSSEIHSLKNNIVNITLVKPDGTRVSVPISELTTRLNDPAVWKQQNDTYTLTLEYNEQSRYETKLTVKDMMENEAFADYNFWLDTAAPDITSVDIETDYENKNNTSYNKFDASKAEITVKLKEEIVSADQISVICKTKDLVTGEEKDVVPSARTKNGNIFTYSFTLKRDFKGSISFVTSDGLNNGSSAGVDMANGIILEGKEQHQLSSAYNITENGTPNENGFYRKDVSLKFTAQDAYSGIRTIEYSLNGKKTTEDFSKQKELKTDWEKNPVYLEAMKENEGNDIKAVLTVVDNAGHKDTVEKSLKIDVTKPDISVSYDNNNVQNEKYYKDNRIATITIKELNYDAQSTSVVVYKDGIPITKTPAFHSDGRVKKAENGTQYKEYKMQLPFTEDGDYTFKVETTDLAGNKGTYVVKSEFTIDKTAPKLELHFDNNSPFKEQYFGEGRTATLTVTEHNFDPAGIVATTKATKAGAELAAPVLSSFTSNGDVYTAKIAFHEEADYSISISGVDLAGNAGDAVSEQTFTVDLSAPEILITGIKEGSSYNREVEPVVTVIDGNYDADGVVIEIIGGRNGEIKDITPVISQTDRGYSYSYPNLKYLHGYDDCYMIKATVVDKAGHEAEAVMNYRVNRFGSTYVLNDALQKMVDNYYGHASDEYSIIETNVDTLKQYQVSYTLDGEIVNLKEGTDYTVVKSADAGNWNQYEYKLKASVFEREGIYAITVASKDAAGNVTDNKAKNTIMEFCIDNTAPSCVISGVAEGQRFEKDETVSIGVEVYDNTRLGQVSVMLNGNELYTEKDLVDGKITDISIDRTVKNQSLTVISHDAAGNERVETIHFTCQVGVFDMPVWLWLMIAVAGAGVIVFLVAVRRRRKRPV